ncbi:hypothetical protein RGQ15_15840 [Paracoccus sp. MBLB3053]|uniref:Putative 4-hydroxy-4-methyl-2-oxoglutarate aldolase n=1 Tax=Paracoccus aurantius TaxID=3073814 RepID=A0ABU2HVF5_9RHOB|nr:hypothetical protein [Paracoccus sp. MBLB3053]MDS9469038.1 hypothetical protein [Paracoccus sp. MBLB3053]
MSVTINTPQTDPIDPELLARWRRIPVPVIVDLASECQIDIALRPLLPPGRQPSLFGRVVTARCSPPDFGSVLHAIATIREGDVLVIDAGGEPGWAMIGDVLGGHLHRLGVAGIVCDGAVRDTGALAGMAGLSVYSRHINPRGPVGASQGEVNAAVRIGGCTIAPGDLIIGDDDGLAALRPAHLTDLIEPAETKLSLEARWISRLAADEPITRIFGLE